MCLTYQWALVNSVLNFVSFLIFVEPHLQHHNEAGRTLIFLNNTMPAVILLGDFFINCVPFIMRHCIPYLFIELLLILDLFYENRAKFDNFSDLDYREDD